MRKAETRGYEINLQPDEVAHISLHTTKYHNKQPNASLTFSNSMKEYLAAYIITHHMPPTHQRGSTLHAPHHQASRPPPHKNGGVEGQCSAHLTPHPNSKSHDAQRVKLSQSKGRSGAQRAMRV
jgi:hypothetical protein